MVIQATNNILGGSNTGMGNLISGNSWGGVEIVGHSTFGNAVRGNFIGTNAASTAAVPNQLDGVLIYDGARNNTIGGTGSNTIAFNGG